MSEYQKIQSEPATHPMDFQSGVGRIVRERDALLKDLAHARKQTAELVEAVLQTNKADILDWQYVYNLALKLKEQDDE